MQTLTHSLSPSAPFSPLTCPSIRPGAGSSPQQVDAGQTPGPHLSALLLCLPLLLLPHRVQHLHLRQPAHVPGRLRHTGRNTDREAGIKHNTHHMTMLSFYFCVHTLECWTAPVVLGCKVAEKENSEFYLFLFSIFFGGNLWPVTEGEEEEVSLCSLRVCDADIKTDGQKLRTTTSCFNFFLQTPPPFPVNRHCAGQ